MTSWFVSLGGKVEMAFGSDPLDTPSWTDVTTDVREVHTDRGRDDPLQPFNAGTASIVLNNLSAQYDPLNSSGAHYGDILPLVPVRVSALDSSSTRQYLYYGYVQPRGGWTFDYSPNFSTATVSCVDFLGILATQEMPTTYSVISWVEYNLALNRVLAGLGYDPKTTTAPVPSYVGYKAGPLLAALVVDGVIPAPFPGWAVDTGQNPLLGYTGGENTLQFCQKVAQSDGGELYITKDGVGTFDERHAILKKSRMTTSQATYDDSGSNIPYSVDGLTFDYATQIINKATFTNVASDAEPQVVEDATSITAYTQQDYSLSGLIYDGGSYGQALAARVVAQYKDPHAVVRSLQLKPRRSTAVLDGAIQRELRDKVTVKFAAPGSGAGRVTTTAFVERIAHDITADGDWTTTLGFSSATLPGVTTYTDFLKLNDATYGKLNTGKLAF